LIHLAARGTIDEACAPTAQWGEHLLAHFQGSRRPPGDRPTRTSSRIKEHHTGPAVDQIEKAKAVCARCTVTEICLQYALETGQDSGVWGGLSEDERRALKRRAARARRAS
jgi:WhiB family redox-sensing transcriptional regulator